MQQNSLGVGLIMTRLEMKAFDIDAHWKKPPCKICNTEKYFFRQQGHSDRCPIYKKWCKENC